MDYAYAQPNDYPLRILVPSDAVGAIIGKQGSTVKQIKQNTHAKVDVNKTEASAGVSNTQERVIVIRGQQENCVQACREILRIMYDDAQIKNKTTEIVLKVLAHNNFIGRIIGKGGNIINSIKKETDTSITVSSINELNSYNVERIISIKGELEQQIHALDMIYGKLCLAHENDYARAWGYAPSSNYYQQQQQQQQQMMHHFAQQAAMMAAGPPMIPQHYAAQQPTMIQQAQNNNSNGTSTKFAEQPQQQQQQQPTATFYHQPYYPPMFTAPGPYYMSYPATGHMAPAHPHPYANVAANGNTGIPQSQHSQSVGQSSQNAPVVNETVHLYVPNTVIGAIIGTKGLFIKSIIKNSNASVKISPLSPHEDQNMIIDRQVTISGTPEAQWKSQYYIFDKIRQEGYAGDDEVRLRAEIYVPTSMIGRLVGKGGQNVRQLQQSTGAIIKLPEDSQQTSATEVPVKILGSFQASQFAQRRIQSIIQMNRDSTTVSNDDSNNNTSEQSTNGTIINNLSSNLNEISTIVNGSMASDDAVVASSTNPHADDSITTAGENDE